MLTFLGCVAPEAGDSESASGYGATDDLPPGPEAKFGGHLLVSPLPTDQYVVPDTEAPRAVMTFCTPDNARVRIEVSGGVESVLLEKLAANGDWTDVAGGPVSSGTWAETFADDTALSGPYRLTVSRQTANAAHTQIRIFDPDGSATNTPYCVLGNSMWGPNATARPGFTYDNRFLGYFPDASNPTRPATGLYLDIQNGFRSNVAATRRQNTIDSWRAMSAMSTALARVPEEQRRDLDVNPLGGNFYANGSFVLVAIPLIAPGPNERSQREYMITTITAASTRYVAHQMMENPRFPGIEGDGFVFRDDDLVPNETRDQRIPVYRLEGHAFVGCAPTP